MEDTDIIIDLNFANKDKVGDILYKECFCLIKKQIIKLGGTPDDAKDIFQETIIAYLLRYNTCKINLQSLKALLLAISKNKWIDQKRRAKKIFYIDYTSYKESINNSESYKTPLHKLIEKENDMAIEQTLSSLGNRGKELLMNSMYYNMSMKEIAEKMGFSNEYSAKTQVHKCRLKLIAQYKNDNRLKSILQKKMEI